MCVTVLLMTTGQNCVLYGAKCVSVCVFKVIFLRHRNEI